WRIGSACKRSARLRDTEGSHSTSRRVHTCASSEVLTPLLCRRARWAINPQGPRGLRGRSALCAPRQDPRAQPIPQFGSALARVEHLLIDADKPGDVAASRISLERAQVSNEGTQALDRFCKTFRNQPLLARFDDGSSGRKGVLGMILHADEMACPTADLGGLDIAHAVGRERNRLGRKRGDVILMRAERIERLRLSREQEVPSSRFSGSDVPGNAEFSAFWIEADQAAAGRGHELKAPAAAVHRQAALEGITRKFNLAGNLSSTLALLGSVAEGLGEAVKQCSWNFHHVSWFPGH